MYIQYFSIIVMRMRTDTTQVTHNVDSTFNMESSAAKEIKPNVEEKGSELIEQPKLQPKKKKG